MYNHAPQDYACPICLGVQKIVSPKTMLIPDDLVFQDALCSAFINSKFIGNNPGHVIVVPNAHIENIYDMTPEVSNHILSVIQKIAIALKKVRNCEGITLVQNNEPTGGQHAFHVHFHVFPRFEGDKLHQRMDDVTISTPKERLPYAKALQHALQEG